MRVCRTGFVSIALLLGTGGAFAVNPPAPAADNPVLHSTLSEVTGRDAAEDDDITNVLPGQMLTITGECVARAVAPEDLQVVLTLTDALGVSAPGYRSVVATDQEMGSSGLQVRVPNMPNTANHVFQVRVFEVGGDSQRVCDAGAIRIGGETPGKVG
jgi:hypothetical protein